MYHIRVYCPGDTSPRQTLTTAAAAHVVEHLPGVMMEHPTFSRVDVTLDNLPLFSVRPDDPDAPAAFLRTATRRR